MIIPVVEARRLSLPSILGAVRPGAPYSIRKPLMRPPSASLFAQTTNRSANGELLNQVLLPDRRKPAPSA
jgi:hypothetical protein